MPCGGPDLNAARRDGNKAAQELLEYLHQKHHIYIKGGPFIWPGSKERWEKAVNDFTKAVENIFEEDATNGF